MKNKIEPRTVIPVCNKHNRFMTRNGRWLDSATDLEKHIKHTKSHDALLSDGECDLCVDPNQIDIFKPIYVNFRKHED